MTTPVPAPAPAPSTVDLFRGAMRRLAASVTVITSRHEGRAGGMTATAVCSVSVAPPLLLICVNRQGSTYPLIKGSGRFTVNLLAEGQEGVAGAFARSATGGDDQFAGNGAWTMGAGGAPMLAGAVAALECSVDNAVEAGSHTVFIGRVEGVHLPDPAPAALVYADGGYRKLT